MTDEQLREIEARAERATIGPWTVDAESAEHRCCWNWGAVADDTYFSSGLVIEGHRENVEFCAHARTDVPALVAEVRRLRAESEYDQRNAAMSQAENARMRDELQALHNLEWLGKSLHLPQLVGLNFGATWECVIRTTPCGPNIAAFWGSSLAKAVTAAYSAVQRGEVKDCWTETSPAIEVGKIQSENARLREALMEAADYLYNPFEPDNQCKAYLLAIAALNPKEADNA